jgi:hypothetical protein
MLLVLHTDPVGWLLEVPWCFVPHSLGQRPSWENSLNYGQPLFRSPKSRVLGSLNPSGASWMQWFTCGCMKSQLLYLKVDQLAAVFILWSPLQTHDEARTSSDLTSCLASSLFLTCFPHSFQFLQEHFFNKTHARILQVQLLGNSN